MIDDMGDAMGRLALTGLVFVLPLAGVVAGAFYTGDFSPLTGLVPMPDTMPVSRDMALVAAHCTSLVIATTALVLSLRPRRTSSVLEEHHLTAGDIEPNKVWQLLHELFEFGGGQLVTAWCFPGSAHCAAQVAAPCHVEDQTVRCFRPPNPGLHEAGDQSGSSPQLPGGQHAASVGNFARETNIGGAGLGAPVAQPRVLPDRVAHTASQATMVGSRSAG